MSNRCKLPENRIGLIRKKVICGFKCYINVNFYDDSDEPAEVFVDISKHGSILSGLIDSWATTVSIALQYGVPWDNLKKHYIGRRFDPFDDDDSSIIDGIAKELDKLISDYKELNSGTTTELQCFGSDS